MKIYYYTTGTKLIDRSKHFTVIEVIDGDKDKAKTYAKKYNLELAGGWFTENAIPHNLKTNYTILKCHGNTKPITFQDEPMNPYKATVIVEGFNEGENASKEDQINAWQYLIDTGKAWSLQGWYGRTATRLIQDGICHA